jgi:hypothetical protein
LGTPRNVAGRSGVFQGGVNVSDIGPAQVARGISDASPRALLGLFLSALAPMLGGRTGDSVDRAAEGRRA